MATAAGNADRFRSAPSPKYENNKEDANIRQWLPVIKRITFVRLQLRIISVCMPPRIWGSLWTSRYEAYKPTGPR
jgi:hypothetical protein